MTSKKSQQNKTPDQTIPSAKAAYKAVEPRLAALASSDIVRVNVDVQVAASAALGVALMITDPAILKRFKNLAKSGEFNASCVEDLALVARATFYARHMALRSEGTRSLAQLPVVLADRATSLRGKMAKTSEYNLSDNPKEAAELEFLRSGKGYLDLANDLLAYGAMYERNKDALSVDKKNYDPRDAVRARELAEEIITLIGTATVAEERAWADAQARAFTLLLKVYAEVQRGGRFLFTYDDAEAKFPSLISVARASASRPVKGEASAPSAEATA